MRQGPVLLAPLLILAMLLGGCSQASEDRGVDLLKATTGNYRIGILSNNTFAPMHGHVPVGATVEWLDNGGMHDVTDADHDPPLWSSYDVSENRTPMRFGDLYTHTFLEAGTYHFKCTIHGAMGMTGTLTVG